MADFTRNGAPWTGAFLVGTTTNTGNPDQWLMYFSDIAVPKTDDTSVAQALVSTWQSWDPSAGDAARLDEARASQQATTGIIRSVNAFRQGVVEVAAENWDAYIRM
jgi:hypothetical protein